MNFRNIFILFAACLLLSQCVDEIDLEIDGAEPAIVIDGLISDSLQVHTIKVSNSAIIGIGNDNILTPISGAKVKVLDDEGGVFEFLENEDNAYELEFQGEIGRTYSVEVELPDGKKILSFPSTIKASPEVGEISNEIFEVPSLSSNGQTLVTNGIRLRMDLDVSDMDERPFLRWRAEGEYEILEQYPGALSTKICYVKTRLDLNLIKIFDTNVLMDGKLDAESVLSTEYDYKFSDQYCFHVFQYSMDKREFNYWDQVNDIVNISGNFFDPPPGTVQGNLYNPDDPKEKVLGYFSVVGLSFKRYFVDRDKTGVFVRERCSSSPFQPQYQECMDCSMLFNSSTVRPDYWIF